MATTTTPISPPAGASSPQPSMSAPAAPVAITSFVTQYNPLGQPVFNSESQPVLTSTVIYPGATNYPVSHVSDSSSSSPTSPSLNIATAASSSSTLQPTSESSTSPPTPTTTELSATTSASSTTTPPIPNPQPNDYRTSLIAVAAVLGGVLAIALIALLILLIRNRRYARTRNESDSTVELKESPDRSIRDLQNTIIGLEKTIDDRNSTIRHTQAALLRNGHSTGDAGLGDVQIRDRFTALSHSINDWVLTYFQKARFDNVQSPDAVAAFKKAVPGYQKLIQDPRTRYLAVRAVIAGIIVEAFANGDFIGSAAYSVLKQGVDIDAHESEYSSWSATTVALLEKSPRFQSDRASAVQNLVSRIDHLTSSLAGLDYSEQRLNHLRTPIDTASKLAVTLAKQPALYTLESDQPGQSFNPDTMEDALQDAIGHTLKGRKILGTAFPAVKKRSVPEGAVVSQALYLRKAQVII